MRLALLAALALAAAAPVAAQKTGAFSGPLLNAKEVKCTFTNYATARWDTGAPKVTTGTDSMALSLTTIDSKKGTAILVAAGTVPVNMAITATGMTVIESTPIGNRNLLTVFATPNKDGASYPAVYSRHLGDTASLPTPSQYYGTCTIVN
jgi:hypothetical protein